MKSRPTKYIFVTGGVVSSLGKGLTCASLAAVLESRGLKVTICKIDPYLNVDPGTMSPFQHGEVFVTEDGAETDLDLGHYERFLSTRMRKENNFTAGQVYDRVIKNERRGEYLGGTVQVVPHVTDEIKRRVLRAAEGSDILIGEVGGTVGDIEGLPFLEAIRQFRADVGPENVLYVHLTLVPYISAAGEIKTKPTQHSVKELTNVGIQPDIIVLRSERPVERKEREKISLFCNVNIDSVICAQDVESIYDVPLVLNKEGLDARIAEKLNIWASAPDLEPWRKFGQTVKSPKNGRVRIAMVGKYVDLTESYKSLHEAVIHGGVANDCAVDLSYVDSELIETEGLPDSLTEADAVLVLPGFGERGCEGKIRAVQYAREKGVPFLGICLGMQMAVIEFVRNVLDKPKANSEEFDDKAEDLVIHFMDDQKDLEEKGGTMRLGAYPCELVDGSLALKTYGSRTISERHRHRYEVNNKYRDAMESAGMYCSGVSPDGNLVEIVEIKEHPWFIGVQFHPEFQSRPLKPHPLFSGFIEAAKRYREEQKKVSKGVEAEVNGSSDELASATTQ